MIVEIYSVEQARSILLELAKTRQYGEIIFDIHESVDASQVPLVIRVCQHCHTGTYVGQNIWGAGSDLDSTYCPSCGFAMREMACVVLAVQKDKVINCGYRYPQDSIVK